MERSAGEITSTARAATGRWCKARRPSGSPGRGEAQLAAGETAAPQGRRFRITPPQDRTGLACCYRSGMTYPRDDVGKCAGDERLSIPAQGLSLPAVWPYTQLTL